MEVRYLPNSETYQRMNTDELRRSFVLEHLFIPGTVTTVYCDTDRAIVGGVVPLDVPLKLSSTKREMAAEYFTERREIGIVNIGGEGIIHTDGQQNTLSHKDMFYVGRGVKDIEFFSTHSMQPAVFFLVSFPAHAAHPVAVARSVGVEATHLGSLDGANKRTIHKYIHAGGVRSCQLVMGLTDLEVGSVWNTMPPHTHMRRTEVYLYFGLDAESVVVHMMGKPDKTRSIILRNQQAVISPSWSIHCGAGTKNYSFVWAMGGENQEFSDMDAVTMGSLY